MTQAGISPVKTYAGRFIWLVFVAVALAQFWLVAHAGTDIPIFDQWDVEGKWLYPTWIDGNLRIEELFRPHNEHRIVWTHVLNLILFAVNGQWDPLIQLMACVILRSACAALVAWILMRTFARREAGCMACLVVVAFLPHLSWHNVLWGFQSQVEFCLGFSLLAIGLLGGESPTNHDRMIGWLAALCAQFAMGAGLLLPFAYVVVAGWRMVERRSGWRSICAEIWPAVVLILLAIGLRTEVPEHASLQASTPGDAFYTFGQMMAWPHTDVPMAALVLNLPMIAWMAARFLLRWKMPSDGGVAMMGAWTMAICAASAWSRGGGEEFMLGVPSRYVDFVVLLPLVNAWCAVALMSCAPETWLKRARLMAIIWAAFLSIGWLGLSAQTMRGIILPRIADRDAPVRLAVEFQRTDNDAVFLDQPRLLLPHLSPDSVRVVLHDGRLLGKLPPSFQPDVRPGSLTLMVRWADRHNDLVTLCGVVICGVLLLWRRRGEQG